MRRSNWTPSIVPRGDDHENPTEGWSRGVSESLAQELRRRCDLQMRDVPSTIQVSLNGTKATTGSSHTGNSH
jgi:hypothetical protein